MNTPTLKIQAASRYVHRPPRVNSPIPVTASSPTTVCGLVVPQACRQAVGSSFPGMITENGTYAALTAVQVPFLTINVFVLTDMARSASPQRDREPAVGYQARYENRCNRLPEMS